MFGGDEQTGPDVASLQTWAELGVPVEQTTRDNWWSNGPVGPCGPDSEMFVWTGDGPPQGTPGSDEGWMELWNHVTMRYRRHADGGLEPLPQRGVDTGMGLERLLMVLEGKPSVFEADVFEPWLSTLPGLWQPDQRSLRLPGAAHRAAASRSATAATAARSSGPPSTWNRIGIAASHSPAYIAGLLVVPVRTHRLPSPVRSRRPIGGLTYRAASS